MLDRRAAAAAPAAAAPPLSPPHQADLLDGYGDLELAARGVEETKQSSVAVDDDDDAELPPDPYDLLTDDERRDRARRILYTGDAGNDERRTLSDPAPLFAAGVPPDLAAYASTVPSLLR